ncbi:MAG: YdcF family protein [Flavobacteriales bacterium]|nr:YdcF family protein [Flavobacteriales bacterium]
MKIFQITLALIFLLSSTSFTTFSKDKEVVIYDAIIIPGYPFNPDGEMNVIYKMRLHWAYKLYSEGVAKNIIVSGSAVHSPYIEAEIFALYLKEMGVNADHLIIENRAEHSLENVFYSLELAKQRGFKKVAVATDLFQSGMIQILGRKHKLEVDYLPANIGYIISKKWKSFDGTIDYCLAYVDDFTPLKERESKQERLDGTRGNRWMEENALTLNNPITD